MCTPRRSALPAGPIAAVLVATALAGEPALAGAPEAPPADAPAATGAATDTGATDAVAALATLDAGDLAWWRGDRPAAAAAYRQALGEVRDDPSPLGRAVEAMARVRLLQFDGNLAPFVHEGPLDRALDACPEAEPWCAVALADWHLFMPAFTGADPAAVEGLLRGSPLGAAALARRVAAGADPALLAGGEAPPGGMARGIAETGRRRPDHPGTWFLGVGVGGAPGAGVGGLVRFVHPDLGGRRLRLDAVASADTRGGGALAATLARSTWNGGGAVYRSVADRWIAGEADPYVLAGARISGAWTPGGAGARAALGAGARVDVLDGEAMAVAGPSAALTFGSREAWTRVSADTGVGAYAHVALGFDARVAPPLAGGRLALRAAATAVPTPESPFFRWPTAGGQDLLRGLPAGRYRAPSLLAAQAEWRRTLFDPLGAALFADAAWIAGGFHWTAGAGLRIALPPEGTNTTRLDVGFGPEGWGVVAAWGEAF